MPPRLHDLLEQISLKEDEAIRRLELARSRQYWQELAPLSIESMPAVAAPLPPDVRVIDVEADRLGNDGYFVLPPMLPGDAVSRLGDAYDRLSAAGWPVAFAFVFDDAWNLFRHPVLHAFLERVLGRGYRAMARIWAHRVAPQDGAAGWHPHFDGSTLANRVTVWISLSHATADNGCIHLIPKSRIGAELNEAVFNRPLAPLELRTVLHAIKAVTTEPGQAIGWSFDVLHWGGVSGSASVPRKSLALELIGPDAEPLERELPLFDLPKTLPTFEERLAAIGANIVSYKSFDLWAKRFVPLGRLLAQH